MAEKPEDFNMPAAVVAKIIKDALPDGVKVSSDARSAVARAASIFILYTTTCANTNAASNKRRTLSAQDVIDSLAQMSFDEFIPQLAKFHEAFRREKNRKDKQKLAAKKGSSTPSGNQHHVSSSSSTPRQHLEEVDLELEEEDEDEEEEIEEDDEEDSHYREAADELLNQLRAQAQHARQAKITEFYNSTPKS